ncbi:YdiY family protein [Pseudoalteromonas fenneropenaei]|uniref:YdiY family protein n=1 Tax=Pseudoalteromonas fenneropenaei TaxID=1737459 RepID=A0ABV7CKA2_9GAMM
MKLPVLTVVAAACLSANVYAKDDKTWEVTSEVGAIVTSGNTETTTLKGGIKAKHNLEMWNNEYKLDGIYKEDEIEDADGVKRSERTNEKYSASVQGNYKLNEKHTHFYVYGGHVSDYFGAYRSESVVSLGYGTRFISNETMVLNAEIGPGYKYFTYQDDSIEVDGNGNSLAGEAEGEPIALGKLDFSWQISDNAKFTQLLAVEYGDTNTKTKSETALLTKINGSLQMKVAFNVTNNSDVAADKENTDTETSLTLVYSF